MAVTAAMRAMTTITQLNTIPDADVIALATERGIPTAGKGRSELLAAIAAKVHRDAFPVQGWTENAQAYTQRVFEAEKAAEAALRW